MLGSWKIARILGIDLFIHWTFWLLPIWIVFSHGEEEFLPLWLELLLIAGLFACVVLHEFGHALMARHFGIGTRNITLSPLGGLAQLERMSTKPWEEFCIAIAGPLVNVAIATVLGFGFLAAFVLDPAFTETILGRFFGALLAINIGLFLFNLLPAFPMDGGRILRAILAGQMGLLPGTRVAVLVGTAMAMLMGMVGLFILGNPWLLLISAFVILAGNQELRSLELEDRRRRQAMQMTLSLWDSRRGVWVRRDFNEPAGPVEG